jgi:hypothetical protein
VAGKKYVKRVSELVTQVSGNYGENMLKGRERKELVKRKKEDRMKKTNNQLKEARKQHEKKTRENVQFYAYYRKREGKGWVGVVWGGGGGEKRVSSRASVTSIFTPSGFLAALWAGALSAHVFIGSVTRKTGSISV